MQAQCPECKSNFNHKWGDVGKDMNCPHCGVSLYLAVEGEDEDFCVVEVIVNDDYKETSA